MVVSDFSPISRALTVGLFISVLSGCSFNGTYPDYEGPDPAKLRFISKLDNVTLNIFDAEHCGGLTTGLMNNLFAANTKRRADMSVPPAEGTKAYLELRLKPGADLMLQTNTLNGYSACGAIFNFTPQSGAEYEVTFDYIRGGCMTTLSRLRQDNGKTLRSPIPLVNKGLPSCNGSNPIFPKKLEAQPSTPERTALIDQIIEQSLTKDMTSTQVSAENEATAERVDKVVSDRKKLLGVALPEAYWAEYRENVITFAHAVGATKARALQLYKDQYRSQLEGMETNELKTIAPDSADVDLSKAMRVNSNMMEYYNRMTREVLKESMSENLARMADLDRRYEVCKLSTRCWVN